MNDCVLNKVDEIVTTIIKSKEYGDYQYLYKKLQKNEKANDLIKEVKNLQKEIVRKESINENVENLEKKLKKYLDELENIPLYIEFVEKQKELNEIYQMIKIKLNDYFYEKLN